MSDRGTKSELLQIPFIPDETSIFADDIVGLTIGHVFVIKQVLPFDKGNNKIVYRYLVRCDCGTEFIAERYSLVHNMTNPDFNCGHLYDSWFKRISPHDRFGHLEVLYNIDNYMLPSGNRMDLWRCKCDCGTEFNLPSRYIEHGATSCGLCEQHFHSEMDRLIGTTQGRLYIIGRGPDFVRNNGNHRVTYWCKCSCGNPEMILIKGETLSNKKMPTLSCGCLHNEQVQRMGMANEIHGLSSTKIYDIYRGMIRRCYDPRSKGYPEYGGRGIYVCIEWRYSTPENNYEGLRNFYNWSMSTGYRDGLSIDRKDPNGPYAPWNCRWVNNNVQANNKRANVFIDYEGVRYTAAQWSTALGVHHDTITRRIRKGMDPVLAITTPAIGKPINAIYFVDEFDNPTGTEAPEI